MVDLFDRVVLRTNSRKTVDMVCLKCQAVGTQLEVPYGRYMTGEGPYYQEWQNGWVQCKDCGEEMALDLMAGHMRTLHGQAAEDRRSWASSPLDEEPRT